MNHINTHNILTDSQHGFRPRRSCETQLITTHHDIVRQLDRRETKQVDAILLDFAKAFDKVPHKRLTLKLRHYGITGPILHWITAFLTGKDYRKCPLDLINAKFSISQDPTHLSTTPTPYTTVP
nr:uncharacterized protein LOC113807545 [Penaeus vannamei]